MTYCATLAGVTSPHEEQFTLSQVAPKKRRRWLVPVLVGALALAAIGGGLAYALRGPAEAAAAPGSIAACQDAVRKQLRSPATAKFSEDRVVEEVGATHYVHGVVDAQNGFGATVRNKYECIATAMGERWLVAAATLHDWP